MKKSLFIICCIMMTLFMVVPVVAAQVPDMNRLGKISISMTYDGEVVSGGSLTIYRVADVHVERNADYSFAYTQEYADCTVDLNNLANAENAKKIADYSSDKDIKGTKVAIDDNGVVIFENLQLGLYLITQQEASEGFELVNPFLVSVPANKEGVYIYDVDATPKMSLEKRPPEESESESEPESETTPPDIPQTGLTQWPIPILAIGGLFLIIVGCSLYISGKKKKHEN